MNMHMADVQTRSARTAPTYTPAIDTIKEAVRRAEQRIAPLWPLRYFVAVNPYLGLIDHSFESAAYILARRAGARMTAPRSFYAQAIRSGRITDADLEAALAGGSPFPGAPANVAALKAFALGDEPEPTFPILPTVADAARKVTGINWADVVTDLISTWAGAYF
ncbi:MAG: DUF2309 family protein, partial [Roseiflexus sp.]|nr:DUF2309 family protein [Roseiflexus sp.]